MPGRVTVVGSANVDLVLAVPHIVAPGETLLASASSRGAGGKGANQAVACARDGAAVSFVGAVGDDADGSYLRASLEADAIAVGSLRTVSAPTGLAVVSVAADGENAIVVVSGANHAFDELSEVDLAAIGAADVVLLQLELPLPVVVSAAQAATGLVVLNAAPAPNSLPAALLDRVDVLVVNETEAAALGGALAQVPAVVTTLGGDGAVLRRSGESELRVAGRRVEVVDTTGAGDTFCGVLAAALARGSAWPQALERAGVAASLAVTRPGAQAAMPTGSETDAALSG